MTEMKAIEVSAADIEAAIEKGIAELGVSRQEVMIEVLEEPGRRLLGLGSKQARVRLTVIRAPAAPPAPPSATATQQIEDEIITLPKPTERPAKPERPSKPRSKPQASEQKRSQPAQPRRRPEPEAEDELPPIDFEEDEESAPREPISAADLAEEAREGMEVLKELLVHMGIPAQVSTQPSRTDGHEAQHWTLEIRGKELGVLIGKRGETLAALQYITRLITSKKIGRRANLVIDVEGYKARREAMLQRLAQRMAEQAVQRGRTVAMEPMPPHERRIIHLTLRNHPDVTTESVGEGDHRKVTVVPKRPKP